MRVSFSYGTLKGDFSAEYLKSNNWNDKPENSRCSSLGWSLFTDNFSPSEAEGARGGARQKTFGETFRREKRVHVSDILGLNRVDIGADSTDQSHFFFRLVALDGREYGFESRRMRDHAFRPPWSRVRIWLRDANAQTPDGASEM